MKTFTTAEIEHRIDVMSNGNIQPSQSPFYHNTFMRNKGINIEMTESEKSEYDRCSKDPVYFAETYCQFRNLGTFSLPKLTEAQKLAITSESNRTASITSNRQTGMSISTTIRAIHDAIFKNRITHILAAHTKQAREITNKFRETYERLPFFLQKGILHWTQDMVIFEDGSGITAKEHISTSAIPNNLICLYWTINRKPLTEIVTFHDGTTEEFTHTPRRRAEEILRFNERYASILPVVVTTNGSVIAEDYAVNIQEYDPETWKIINFSERPQ